MTHLKKEQGDGGKPGGLEKDDPAVKLPVLLLIKLSALAWMLTVLADVRRRLVRGRLGAVF